MASTKESATSLIAELRLELEQEGFTLRDETSTNFEFSSMNAEGESKTVYVDKEELSVCLSENDGAGVLTRADKYLIQGQKDLDTVRNEVFASI